MIFLLAFVIIIFILLQNKKYFYNKNKNFIFVIILNIDEYLIYVFHIIKIIIINYFLTNLVTL